MQECWLRSKCNGIDCDKPFCLKKFKIDKLYENSLLSEKHKKHLPLRIDEDGSDRESFKRLAYIERGIENFVKDGFNLYIQSPTTGNGKTSWAIRLLKAYIFSTWHKSDVTCKVLFVHVPKFLLAIKDNITQKSEYVQYIKENVYDADLVVFDELSTKSLTQFEHEHVLSIINYRLEAGKANIYTSNLTDEEMLEKLGTRLYSRIVIDAEKIVLCGRDKRGMQF